MNSPDSLDFASQPVPDEWLEAEAEAPQLDSQRRRPREMRRTPPVATSLDMFAAIVAGAATSIVFGYGWYELQMSGFTTPWVAVVLGAVIALAIRLGGGREDVQARSMVALLTYIATASVVVFIIARSNYISLYGARPGLTNFEDELLHSRLTEPETILAWLLGAAAAVFTSRLFR